MVGLVDPAVTIVADITDMLFAAISLLIAAACNPAKVLRQIWPHLTVLGLFITFVVWNGGVVLGSYTLPQ